MERKKVETKHQQRHSSVGYKLLLVFFDVLCIYLAIHFSIRLISQQSGQLDTYRQNTILFWGLACLCSVGIMVPTKCYANNISQFNIVDALKMAICLGCGCVIFAGINRLIPQSLPFLAALNSFMLSALLFCGYRLAFRGVLWYHGLYYSKKAGDTSQTVKKTLIFGAGEVGVYLYSRLIYKAKNDRQVMGFLDDDPHLKNRHVKGVKVLGGRKDIPFWVNQLAVDEIIIAVPRMEASDFREIYSLCEQANCSVKRFGNLENATLIQLSQVDISEIKLEDLLGRSVVNLEQEQTSVKKLIRNKVVLVTGGAGSIGSEICSQVLAYGASKLIAFDFNENGLFFLNSQLTEKYGSDRLEIVLGSIRDVQRLNEVFEKYKPQLVFHAAAHKHVPMMEINPFEALINNTIGTYNTASVAQMHGVDRFVMISTDKAVNPTNYMGASKRIAELIIQYFHHKNQGNTRFATVRFVNVLGSIGSVVPIFQKQINEGGPITVTDKKIKRYFMTISEAVHLVLDAGSMTRGGEIFVLNMGEPVYIYELAETMIRLAGLVPDKDIKIEITGLRPGEKLFEEINLSSEEVTPTDNQKIFILKSEKIIPEIFEEIYNRSIVK